MTRLYAILFLCLALRCFSAESVTVQNCTTNALQFVFVGDGWVANERTNFLRFVSNLTGVINQQAWTAGYSNRIKVVAVLTNSTSSGITATAPNSDTPLGGYVSGSSVRVDGSKLFTIIGDAGVSGDYKPIAVLNIGDYKATTLSGRLVITTNAEQQIVAHEIGHLLGNLDDEYAGGGASALATNIAASATEGTNKWGRFIPPLGTPVAVDSIFVPSATCKMGANIQQPFCLVCSNELNRIFFETAGITNVAFVSSSTLTIGILRIGQ